MARTGTSARTETDTARADRRRNRQLILEATTALLLENPQASMAEIAERAGLTRSTVYRHYPDRDELLRAVAAQSAAQTLPVLLDEMRPYPWPEACDLLAQRVVDIGAQYRDVILVVAPRLLTSAYSSVTSEPVQAEVAARRAANEIASPLPDLWLSLCIRTLCMAAIGRLALHETDPYELTRNLARSLRAVTAAP